jgi:hypothetical protein
MEVSGREGKIEHIIHPLDRWQVGNFLVQKQLKVGVRVLSSLYYAKTAFGCNFG